MLNKKQEIASSMNINRAVSDLKPTKLSILMARPALDFVCRNFADIFVQNII